LATEQLVVVFELQMLGCSVVLGLVHVVAASHSASLQRGYRWTASARDEPTPPLQGIAGRLARALNNFSETFPLFAALVLAVLLVGKSGQLSQWGAGLYFAGRLMYLPLYAFGVPLIRSLVWNVATFGIILLLVALLWGVESAPK
jgi:uncharacterized MAPEG superfamily protein